MSGEQIVSEFSHLAISPKGKALTPTLLLRRIGAGFDGNVFRAEDSETGEVYAIKQPSSPRSRRASMSPEGRALAKGLEDLHHENVLEYKHGFENGDMVMEYVEGGTLLDVIEKNGGKLREDQAAVLLDQVVNGLHYLHSKGVVHKDIKPANLLIDSKQSKVKISDIAGETDERPGGVKVPVGTPVFLAPEVVRTGKHVAASDIWSVGCCALQCLTGRQPWDEEDNPFCAMFKVGNGQAPAIPPGFSRSCQHFMEDCFTTDPAERPTASDLLEHPFLQYFKTRRVGYRRAKSWGGDDMLESIPSVPNSHEGSFQSRTSSVASQTNTARLPSSPDDCPRLPSSRSDMPRFSSSSGSEPPSRPRSSSPVSFLGGTKSSLSKSPKVCSDA